MRRLAAVLIAAAALWPVVIASAATADPGVSAGPTPTPTPSTDIPAPSPTPTPIVVQVGLSRSPTPTPTPTPGPGLLVVTQSDGSPVYGQQLAQTGNTHYTVTMTAPSGLTGTWALTDDAPSQITGPTVDADNTARWDWAPWEFYTHHLTGTFHPDCAAQPCPPDVVGTGSYVVFEAYPTPSPTPTPALPPGFHGDYPPPSPPQFTVTPDSPAPQNTVEILSATPQWQAPAGGTIRFTDNGTELTTATVAAHDTATFTVTLPPGQHTLTATFNGQCPAVYGPDSSLGCSYGTTSSATITYVVSDATPSPSPPSPTPEPTLAVPLPTPPAGLTGPALAFWQKLIAWLLGQLKGLTF